LARILLIVVVTSVVFNIVYLVPQFPDIPIHENHYFFAEDAHMQRGHNIKNNIHKSKSTNITVNSNNNNNIVFDDNDVESDQQRVHDLLIKGAGIELTAEMKKQLPTWTEIRQVVGSSPTILGLDSCSKFRDNVPPLERMLGASGMFNTGTNLITHLLKQNCEIPERREKSGPHQSKESYGMRWQVPWGKHTPVKFRNEHSTEKASAINKDYILPVVTIRHPYSWFGSMCKNAYTAKWDHRRTNPGNNQINRKCPSLKVGSDTAWNPVTVTYADKRSDHHLSLAHLWNDWYSYYLNGVKGKSGDIPFVIVRMEDLVFYPKETITAVCECAGGKIQTEEPFHHITASAKGDSQGHDTSTGLYEAWVKYSKPNTKERYGLIENDYVSARTALNGSLMEILGYHHPS